MTGRYHGRPVPAHTPLAIHGAHFERWLGLFRDTAREVCTPAGAAHVIERAERIARSLHIAVEEALWTCQEALGPGSAPTPRGKLREG